MTPTYNRVVSEDYNTDDSVDSSCPSWSLSAQWDLNCEHKSYAPPTFNKPKQDFIFHPEKLFVDLAKLFSLLWTLLYWKPLPLSRFCTRFLDERWRSL